MAYAAATCLKKTIERLLYYPHYICLVPPSTETIQVVHTEADSLIELLRELDGTSKGRSRKRVNAVDAQIREAVSEFEDVLESHVIDQLLSQSDLKRNGDAGAQFSVDLMDLEQDVHSFTERVTELKKVYTRVLHNMLFGEEEEDDDVVASSVTDFRGTKSNMVGLSYLYHKIKAWVLDELNLQLCEFALVGMGGIGKTTLAKKIFDDPDVQTHFHHRLWVTLGRKCRPEEILRVLVAQLNPSNDKILAQGAEDMGEYLKKSLQDRRFLIVVDDLWEKKDTSVLITLNNHNIWLMEDVNGLITSGNQNGSRILFTSRYYVQVHDCLFKQELPFLNKEESWELLREKVFGKEKCPYPLVKPGKKIAEECEGLPLTIVEVAKLLSKAEMTPEYWDEVAEDRNSVFTDAYEEVIEVLYPSYDYLPQHLKMCFLSAGVFPRKTVIRQSKLVNMWEIEEFLDSLDENYITQLVTNNVFMIHQRSRTNYNRYYMRIKTCGVHSSLWHLCKREAKSIKSFHVLNSREDGLSEDMKKQRRLCFHNNMLFAINDVYDSIEDEQCASTARSLGCYGPYHPYQVPLPFGLRLLRLLDTIAIRFYEFPIQVLKLVLLRYLTLTYDGNLPPSISKLWNLQFLIVRQHFRIVKSLSSYHPMEIWDMKELKHLRVTGRDLPDPTPVETLLPNLLTLLDVSGDTCTQGVLKRIPNLTKLGLRIEVKPEDDEPLTFFAHISCLEELRTFKCDIVNPVHRTEATPLPNFSSNIVKLTLSGLCYPWEKLSEIAVLPNLEVLKLQNYAFQGPEWHVKEYSFKRLTSLLIEDTDLVQWKVGYGSFHNFFASISLKHCYKLQEIQWIHSALPRRIQVVDCNPLILSCWNKIIDAYGDSRAILDAHSSWVDGEFESRQVVYNFKGLDLKF